MYLDKEILGWILQQPYAGVYGIALLRLQLPCEPVNLPRLLLQIEREHIVNALDSSAGNITVAANLLGLQRTTLSQRIRLLGLDGKRRERRYKAISMKVASW